MEEYDRFKAKVKGGIGFGSGLLGVYSTFYPGVVMNVINEYIPIPDGEIYGISYKTAIGVTLGIVEIIGGVFLLADI